MKVGLITGEVSGDHLGARLIAALKEIYPDLTVEGILGPECRALQGNALFPMEDIAMMGFVDPIKHLPRLLHIRKTVISHFIQHPPDVFIGIDSPDFNLGVECALKKAGIKTAHYVSPSVWAWRKGRIKKIKKAVDVMLTLFPFEEAFYHQHEVKAVCVGHPLADVIPLKNDQAAAREALGLDPNATYIGILPGSRSNEITHLGRTFIETARHCFKKNSTIQFITSSVNDARAEQFFTDINNRAPELPWQGFVNRSWDVMKASDALLLGSGTVTLEAMLFKRPMVVAYKMAWANFILAYLLVDVEHVSLPNIIAGKALVSEYLQWHAAPKRMGDELLSFVEDEEKSARLIAEFSRLHKTLRMDAAEKAAMAIAELVG